MSPNALLAQLMLTDLNPWAFAWMPVLLDIAIKGFAVLSLTAIVALVLRRASAATRHLIWFLGTLSLLILPILSATLPAWHILPRWTRPSPLSSTTPFDPLASSPAQLRPIAGDVAQRSSAAVPRPSSAARLPTQTTASAVSTRSAALVFPTHDPSLPASNSSSHLPWQTCLLLIWLAGTSLLVLHLLLASLSLRWLEHRSTRIPWPRGSSLVGPAPADMSSLLSKACADLNLYRPVQLLTHPHRTMPMTWGLWRTRLLLPAKALGTPISRLAPSDATSPSLQSTAWPPDQLRAVLLHELAHAKRWDCLTQLLTQLACALYWFNPLIWLAWHRIRAERERACDDLVLAAGTKPSAYAQQLLHIASEMTAVCSSAAAIAMARPTSLEGRLLSILDVTRNRRTLTWGGVTAIVLLLGTISLPLAALQSRMPTSASVIIDAPGSYASPHGVANVFVASEPGGITYRLVFDSSRAPKAKTIATGGGISSDSGWYMCWDAEDRLWIYQPKFKAIHCHQVSRAEAQSTEANEQGGWEGIPDAFLARLPRALKSQHAKFLAAHPQADRLVGPVLSIKPQYQQGEQIAIRLAFDSSVNWELQEGFEGDAQDANHGWKHWFWRINGQENARFGPVLMPTRGSSVTYRNVEGELGFEFPPGRYRVQYVGRDLPIVVRDVTRRRVVAKEIASNQIEFEVIATTAPATQPGASQAQMQAWVLKHLAIESCDMTILRILEWGQPEHRFRDDSWSSIRLKYIGFGFGWDGSFTSDRRYTFTASGDFVRSDYTDKQGPGETKSPELPFKTPEEVIASLHRQLLAMRESFPELADYPDQAPAGLELSYTHDCRDEGKGSNRYDEAYRDTGPRPLAIMLRLKPEKAVGQAERRQEQPTFLPNLRLFKWEGFHAGPNTTPHLKDKIGGLLGNHIAVLRQLDRPRAASQPSTSATPAATTQPALFQLLSIDVGGTIWAGKATLTIRPDGSGTFGSGTWSQSGQPGPWQVATLKLTPEQMTSLQHALEQSDWLQAKGLQMPGPTDSPAYTLKLERGGDSRQVTVENWRQGSYTELVAVIDALVTQTRAQGPDPATQPATQSSSKWVDELSLQTPPTKALSVDQVANPETDVAQANSKIDAVIIFISANALDSAETTLSRLERQSASLSGTVQNRLIDARSRLNAARAAAGAKRPSSVELLEAPRIVAQASQGTSSVVSKATQPSTQPADEPRKLKQAFEDYHNENLPNAQAIGEIEAYLQEHPDTLFTKAVPPTSQPAITSALAAHNAAIRPLFATRTRLESELKALHRTYGPNHPVILNKDKELDELNQQIRLVTRPPVIGAWSQPVNALAARVVLTTDRVFFGTPLISTRLELKNMTDPAVPLRIPAGRKSTFRVLDSAGHELPMTGGAYDEFSGGPKDLVIPANGVLCEDLTHRGSGVQPKSAALIDLGPDSNWHFLRADNDYFLQVLLDAPPVPAPAAAAPVAWHGQLVPPATPIPLQRPTTQPAASPPQPAAATSPTNAFAGFAALPDMQKDGIIWYLHEYKKWGQPDQKPICEDILKTQARNDGNSIAWTTDAIDLVEAQNWTDLAPLVQKVYERPRNIWVYERAFRYLRRQAGHPVPPELIAAAHTIGQSQYASAITDAQLNAATDHLARHADKEAVMVYAIQVAAWHAGKGGTDRGRRAAADILAKLDRNTVANRVFQLHQDLPDRDKPEIEWLAQYLHLDKATASATTKPADAARINQTITSPRHARPVTLSDNYLPSLIPP